MKTTSKFPMLLAITFALTLSSCTAMLDILVILTEEDYCCTAYRYDGCELGSTSCYEDCQDMLEYEEDYCICNCPD